MPVSVAARAAEEEGGMQALLLTDGREIGKALRQVNVMFCLLKDGLDVLKEKHLYPLGTYKIEEKRDEFEEHLVPLFDKLKALRVDGKLVQWFMGGDLKSLAMFCGAKRACDPGETCPWCRANFTGRRQLDKSWKIFDEWPADRDALTRDWIPPNRVIADPLHCLLRKFDVLQENLSAEVEEILGTHTHILFVLFV